MTVYHMAGNKTTFTSVHWSCKLHASPELTQKPKFHPLRSRMEEAVDSVEHSVTLPQSNVRFFAAVHYETYNASSVAHWRHKEFPRAKHGCPTHFRPTVAELQIRSDVKITNHIERTSPVGFLDRKLGQRQVEHPNHLRRSNTVQSSNLVQCPAQTKVFEVP